MPQCHGMILTSTIKKLAELKTRTFVSSPSSNTELVKACKQGGTLFAAGELGSMFAGSESYMLIKLSYGSTYSARPVVVAGFFSVSSALFLEAQTWGLCGQLDVSVASDTSLRFLQLTYTLDSLLHV